MTYRSFAAVLLLATLACKDTGGPSFTVRPLLGIVGGDLQVDTVAQTLDQPVVARATDSARGTPASGVILNWFRVVGTDTVFIGAGSTNDSGLARLIPTLATKAGNQDIVAWALDEQGRRSVHASARATALPGPLAYAGFAVHRARLPGDSLYRLPVTAADQYENPVVPIIRSMDSTRVGKPDGTGEWRASGIGAARFIVQDPAGPETLTVWVSPPIGEFRVTYQIGDTVIVETGAFTRVWVDSTTVDGNACFSHGPPAGVHGRESDDVTVTRTVLGVALPAITGARSGIQHSASDTTKVWYFSGYDQSQARAPACRAATHAPTVDARWRFLLGADSLVISVK